MINFPIDKSKGPKLIGQRLLSARKHNNLKGTEVALLLRIEKSALSHIETGKNYPNVHNLIKLCILYKVSPLYILGFIENYTHLSDVEIEKIKVQLIQPSKKPGSKMGTDTVNNN